jgi:hypothetical protein
MAKPKQYEARNAIEDMALALYDHFNPCSVVEIKVGKHVCLQMAEAAFRVLARSPAIASYRENVTMDEALSHITPKPAR